MGQFVIAQNQMPYYFTASFSEGEGVWSLLSKYEIANSCNIDAFYKINNLEEDDVVYAEKKYKLPVEIYEYNGRSIRSSIGISDWDRAVAIKEFNETILDRGIRQTHYADSKILWVPAHLLDCEVKQRSNQKSQDNTVKAAEKNMQINNLFGSKYAEYEVVDESLKDQVFYIVSGHGGPDPGAMCTDHSSDLCEDEYAYDVCLRLARNLRQHGAIVEMIIQDKNDGIRDEQFLDCDYDETCGSDSKIPRSQKRRLQQRAGRINQLYANYKSKGYSQHKVIVVHVDANRASHRQDVFFYHHKNSKSGKRLAENIYNTFESKYDKHQKGRGYSGSISSRGLYMINYTHPPTVYVELGNIKNHKDQKRLLLNSNRQALANWLFEGLIAN